MRRGVRPATYVLPARGCGCGMHPDADSHFSGRLPTEPVPANPPLNLHEMAISVGRRQPWLGRPQPGQLVTGGDTPENRFAYRSRSILRPQASQW